MTKEKMEELKKFIENLDDSERMFIVKQCLLTMKTAKFKIVFKGYKNDKNKESISET